MIAADCTTGETCAPLGADSFCVASCTTSADCSGGQVCVAATDGDHVCASTGGTCSAPPDAGTSDAGRADAGVPVPDAGTPAADAGTPTPDAGTPTPDAGEPAIDAGFASNVTAEGGGTESWLYFAVTGDTRPPLPDDDSSYPTAIISQIYQDIQALTPRPPFVIGTGDYQFTIPDLGSTSQTTELGYYAMARSIYDGAFWPAMGNHECDGVTGDECGPGTLDGNTSNFTVFMQDFVMPLGETNPYYSRTVSATDGSWTANFIILALNYWSDAQQTWFAQQLTTPATYTFVIHHENSGASGAPSCLATVESMEAGHETLSIVGHSHQWAHTAGTSEVIVGNGGAPLDVSNQNYGYTLVEQQPDGSLLVTNHDYMTNQVAGSFTVP